MSIGSIEKIISNGLFEAPQDNVGGCFDTGQQLRNFT